jgi:hypothetical protein
MQYCFLFLTTFFLVTCTKKPVDPPLGGTFRVLETTVDGQIAQTSQRITNLSPQVKIRFSEALIDGQNLAPNIHFKNQAGANVPFKVQLSGGDSTLVLEPEQALKPLDRYDLSVFTTLKGKNQSNLSLLFTLSLLSGIDTTDKFPRISDDSLMTLVQKQTFKYFWDFGHPVSGLSPERNSTPNVVTSGGTGFGVMAIVVGAHRGFVTRAQAAERVLKMTNFLKTKTKTYHGTFPHWLDGTTGATIPFSPKDNGADLVETSYLMQGLLCARAYFNENNPTETAIRSDVNALFGAVEWNWFTQGGQNVLYWHWSENFGWQMNHQIQGWNEALITYIMAASGPVHTISRDVYEKGWAKNGAIKNGKSFYGHTLPLGWDLGGPLFFSHYTFLGIDPRGLKDQYADYQAQTRNHSLINYAYCTANPKKWYGYSADCWGLTASDTYDGYTAHEPNNDRGVISPTAALSSMPFTPTESTQAMRYFYYTIGDKIYKNQGFVDAFSLERPWFSDQFLAIDQGPIIVQIENHRSGLLWQLFTDCPEVKAGMRKLGFTAPYL